MDILAGTTIRELNIVLFRTTALMCWCLGMAALGPESAHANGAPGMWSAGTPGGAFIMKEDPDIRLRSEALELTLTDADHYSVRAHYDLQNNGGEKTVVYGVPILMRSVEVGLPGSREELLKKVQEKADAISLSLNSSKAACMVAQQDAAAKVNAVFEEQKADYEFITWCAANLQVGGKRNNALTLEYSDTLFSLDAETNKSNMTNADDRTLRYLFYPAGYWQGKVDSLKISVNMERSPYWSLKADKGPTGHQLAGKTAVWSLKNLDFKTLPEMVLRFSGSELDKALFLNGLKRPTAGVTVTASSTLPDQGKANYKAANVLDGKLETAWCEGVAGSGKGEWIEFRTTRKNLAASPSDPPRYLGVEAIILSPGYIKSQKAYLSNNRISEVQVTQCGKAANAGGEKTRIDVQERVELSPHAVIVPYELRRPSSDGSLCIRMTILDVVKGAADDTCISELSLIDESQG